MLRECLRERAPNAPQKGHAIAPATYPCILTFVTAAGGRCFYATRVRHEDCDEACKVYELPPHVFAQLQALGAELAWRYLGTPVPLAVRGPAFKKAALVDTVADDEFERVVFL
jgi:hypothetical protein